MDTQILEDIGLTPAEVKTYLSLLRLGSVTAGPILEKSGIQNSVLHRALATLVEKGLVSYIKNGKRKIYKAANPQTFITFLEDKKQRAEQLLPELLAQQANPEKTDATLYKGIRGVSEVYHLLVSQKGHEYNTFGGGIECAKRMGMPWWLNIHARRVANKIQSRQIFDGSVKSKAGQIESKPFTKIRYIDATFASFQETVIIGDMVAITTFADTPYSFLMTDKKIADSYRKYFELMWKHANN
jgi:sugar-specific transcriptional regulator TrmB